MQHGIHSSPIHLTFWLFFDQCQTMPKGIV